MLTNLETQQSSLSPRKDSRGYSLLEVVAATFIMLLTFAGVSNGFLTFALQNRGSSQSGESINVAQTVLDRLRLLTVSTLPNGGNQQICNPDTNYTCVTYDSALEQAGSVIVTYCPNIIPSYCDVSQPTTRHILVDVLGNDGDGGIDVVFTAETVFTELRDL